MHKNRTRILTWMLALALVLTGLLSSEVAKTVEAEEPVEVTSVESDSYVDSFQFPTEYTKWEFNQTGELVGTKYAYNGTTTGTYNDLFIDASETGARLEYRASDIMASNGAKVYIPVNGACTLIINAYYTSALSIDGTTLTPTEDTAGSDWQNYTYEYTGTEETFIPVSFDGTGSGYIRSIAAKIDLLSTLKIPTSITEWNFDKTTGGFSGDIQNGDEEVYENMLISSANGGKCTARDQGDTQINKGTSFYVPVNGDTTVSITAYSAGGFTVDGNEMSDTVVNGRHVLSYDYKGYEGTVKIEATAGQYIYSIRTSYAVAVVPGERNVHVWDFGGQDMEGTEGLYSNLLSDDSWSGITNPDTDNRVIFPAAGETAFGDLTLNYAATDRIYTSGSNAEFSDGYTASGMYYTNGYGGPGRRYMMINNVTAGDTIVTYIQGRFPSDSTETEDTLFFEYQGSDGTQQDTKVLTTNAEKFEFTANYSGSYKLYLSRDKNERMNVYRVMRIPAASVTGTLEKNGYDLGYCNLIFTDRVTGEEKAASLNADGAFAAALTPGHTYTASLRNAVGFGISDASKIVSVNIEDVLTGQSGVVLQVTELNLSEVTGTIAGFADGYDLSRLSLSFVPDNAAKDTITATVASDMTYRAALEVRTSYQAQLAGVDDYEIIEGAAVMLESTEAMTNPILVSPVATYQVTGELKGLPDTITATAITFTNEAGYVYTGMVTGNTYKAALRDGTYTVTTDLTDYQTSTHVIVNGENTERDLLFVTQMTEPLTWVSDIYVGYASKANNFATVTEAMTAAQRMNPQSEEQRITIHVAPGTYREQVMVTTPYITLVNDEAGEVLITWYYGIGYRYYSADDNGFYNAELAFDQTRKHIAARWGTAVYVTRDATGFRAQNITFENSFNRYMTEEELRDGAELSAAESDSSIAVERTEGLDVTSKAATERAAAMVIEANQTEFLGCKFLSSQDTLYTGQGITGYFRNCLIEGNTDYIYGYGDFLFDECTLNFYGYSDTNREYEGYITAARTGDDALGYVFQKCTVTGNRNTTITSPQTGESHVVNAPAGYLGRPWGATAKVTFLDTTIEGYESAGTMQPFIVSAGWTSMSGAQPENANFAEYGSVNEAGESIDVSNRTAGTVMDEAEAGTVAALIENNVNGWLPVLWKQNVVIETPDPEGPENPGGEQQPGTGTGSGSQTGNGSSTNIGAGSSANTGTGAASSAVSGANTESGSASGASANRITSLGRSVSGVASASRTAGTDVIATEEQKAEGAKPKSTVTSNTKKTAQSADEKTPTANVDADDTTEQEAGGNHWYPYLLLAFAAIIVLTAGGVLLYKRGLMTED